MKNYRPISSPFISKLIEDVVARRIEEYLEHNNLKDIDQSAYRSAVTLLRLLIKNPSLH